MSTQRASNGATPLGDEPAATEERAGDARAPAPADDQAPRRRHRPVIVPATLLQNVIDHLRSELPNEGCGLLAESGRAGNWSVQAFFPGRNVDRSPHRFTMDPAAVVTALREMDARGWELAAIAHSHPSGPATVSPTDLREAYYPEAAMLIVALGKHPPEVRAWRLEGASRSVVEVDVIETDDQVSPTSSGGDVR